MEFRALAYIRAEISLVTNLLTPTPIEPIITLTDPYTNPSDPLTNLGRPLFLTLLNTYHTRPAFSVYLNQKAVFRSGHHTHSTDDLHLRVSIDLLASYTGQGAIN